MNSMTRETLGVLLLGLLSGCEKDAIRAEKPAESSAPAVQSAPAKSVGATEVTPEGSAKAKPAEKKCAPGGCGEGKCG
jgi:uncharacterized low-complexity protein